MCGIVGYVGPKPAGPLLLEGLKRLEYRGYDSAGLALVSESGLTVYKAAGRISALERQIDGHELRGSVGIAHTRWATHGAPTTVNAHPHGDQAGVLALVHNGIIENAPTLRRALLERGHTFRSETDTEVLAHLIGAHYTGSLEDAVAAALREVEGAYGIVVVSAREPDVLIAARNGSPLLVGVGRGERFVASDASAILAHTREVVYLDDQELAVLDREAYRVRHLDARPVAKSVSTINWDLGTIERGGHAHFMLKEIMEQPDSLQNALRGRLLEDEATSRLNGLNLSDEDLLQIRRVVLTACGTSWHAALIGEYMIEELARVPAEVEYASEFRYRNPIVDDGTLVIGVSQSGETADTLAAIREAKRRGAYTIGIVNVVGSSMAREVDGGIYLHAGPEIGVASTKAFTSQVVALALLALRLGRVNAISILQGREIVRALRALPALVQSVLDRAEEVERLAERFHRATNVLYLGRGYNFPAALEGALKLKEISYIHAEGYPAAEMKHGPIALIDDLMPVVVLAPHDGVHAKVLSNMEEVRARGGRILAVVSQGDEAAAALATHRFEIPETLDFLTPVLTVLPLQLLAYYIAVHRGCNVDQPRNLAKSVTVE